MPFFLKENIQKEFNKRLCARRRCGNHSENRPWENLEEKEKEQERQQVDEMPTSAAATATAEESCVASEQQVAGVKSDQRVASRTWARICQCDKFKQVWDLEKRYVKLLF